MLTSGAAQGDVAKFGREQAVALLTPPIELRTVRAAVQAALSHDSTSQSGVSRTGEYV